MRLEHYSLEKLKKEVLEIVGRYLDLTSYRVFFFGSRVTGKGNDRSDIDIGIEGPAPLRGSTLARIQEDIGNLPTLYKIDIVDFAATDQKFREVALSSIEIIQP